MRSTIPAVLVAGLCIAGCRGEKGHLDRPRVSVATGTYLEQRASFERTAACPDCREEFLGVLDRWYSVQQSQEMLLSNEWALVLAIRRDTNSMQGWNPDDVDLCQRLLREHREELDKELQLTDQFTRRRFQ